MNKRRRNDFLNERECDIPHNLCGLKQVGLAVTCVLTSHLIKFFIFVVITNVVQ